MCNKHYLRTFEVQVPFKLVQLKQYFISPALPSPFQSVKNILFFARRSGKQGKNLLVKSLISILALVNRLYRCGALGKKKKKLFWVVAWPYPTKLSYIYRICFWVSERQCGHLKLDFCNNSSTCQTTVTNC